MVRFILLSILLTLLLRALLRLWNGVVRGIQGDRPPQGRQGAQVPQRGVQMVRDPICGTFIVPNNAIAVTADKGREYFCSTECRDAYLRRGRDTARERTA